MSTGASAIRLEAMPGDHARRPVDEGQAIERIDDEEADLVERPLLQSTEGAAQVRLCTGSAQ